MKMLITLMIILLIFTSCDKRKTTHSRFDNLNIISPKKKHKNEVVLVLKDSVKPLNINIKTNPWQINHELITIGDSDQNTVVIIPTDSILSLSINNSYIYSASGNFYKGDTINITENGFLFHGKAVKHPIFTVPNRKTNPQEINFDYYVSLKTPTIKTFRWYNLFSKREKWKNKMTLSDVYNNTVNVNDSLFSNNLISKDFYITKQMEANIFIAKNKLDKAFLRKKKIEIDSLGVSIYENYFATNQSYINYLISVIKYKYFLVEEEQPKNSEIFDMVISKDTLLLPKLKNAVLDNLLSKIFISERIKFDERFEKVKISPKKYFLLIKKYKTVLTIENTDKIFNNLMKNASGKLMYLNQANQEIIDFRDVVKNERGKIILIDFWASWCIPCRKEMPHLFNLKQVIDSSKFTVISISIDKSFTAWKKASNQEKLNSHNYFLINAQESPLIKDLGINTIPRYLLYDQRSKLIDDNAPRPSDKRLKKRINMYLKN